MLRHEFDAGINRMVDYWTYQAKWSQTKENEYWRAFQGWSAQRWEMAVNAAIDNADYFPRISELRKHGKVDEVPETKEEGEVKSCEHCARGRISFGFVKNGLPYERYLACDCEAGDIAVDGMLKIAHRLDHGVDVPSLRYSMRFADQGGLKTAKDGYGIGILEKGRVGALGL